MAPPGAMPGTARKDGTQCLASYRVFLQEVHDSSLTGSCRLFCTLRGIGLSELLFDTTDARGPNAPASAKRGPAKPHTGPGPVNP